MALCISFGESSTTTVSAQVLLLRFFEKTIESFKHNVTNLFCGVLSCEPVIDPDLRRTGGQGMDAVVGDEFSNNKQCAGGGGDPLVFNILDSMPKGSLKRSVSLCLLLGIFILLQFDASSVIFEAHLIMGCSSLPAPLFNLLPIVMLIGLDVRIHVDLLRVGVCF